MNKNIKTTALVLVMILVFLCGFGVGKNKGFTLDINNNPTAAADDAAAPVVQPSADSGAPADVPTAPAATIETTGSASADVPATPDAPTSPAEPASPAADDTTKKQEKAPSSVPSGKDEIVAKYNDLINKTKKASDVKIHKTSKIDLTLTDLSAASLKNTVNSALQSFMKPSDEQFEIVGGTDAASGKTASDVITPGGRDVALKPGAVASASAKANGDGYTMTIKLKEEKSTFDGTNTVKPAGHESCLSPLNLAEIDIPIPGVNITNADMTYPGATLNVTVNGDGKVTNYNFTLPMSGSGTGKIVLVSLTATIEGAMEENMDFTY